MHDERTTDSKQTPAPDPEERFRVPGAEILGEDTWADDVTCPACGRTVTACKAQCTCGQWIGECAGSCPSCGSLRCVGGRRRVR